MRSGITSSTAQISAGVHLNKQHSDGNGKRSIFSLPFLFVRKSGMNIAALHDALICKFFVRALTVLCYDKV